MIKKKILMRTIFFTVLNLAVLASFLMAVPSFAEGPSGTADFGFVIPDGITQVDSLPGSVWIDGTELFYDQLSKVYFWSINMVADHDPDVRVEGFDNPQILLDTKYDSEEIRHSQARSFIVYDQYQCFEGKIVITTLPIISVTCENEITENNQQMDIYAWDNQQKQAVSSSGEIRIRGSISCLFPKKSYRISLKKENGEKNKLSFLDMRKDDDWILYPAYNDQEKIRNVFCTNLWRDTCGFQNEKGVSNGSEYRFVELFINNTYWGLYALGTRLDKKEMFSKEYSDEVLYKKTEWSDEMQELTDQGVEKLSEYEISKAKGKYEADERACWVLLIEYYKYLAENKNDSAKLISHIDVKNYTYLAVFLNLVQGVDNSWYEGFIKNMYLCITDNDGQIMSIMAPWDLDLTFGNAFDRDSMMNYTYPYKMNPTQNSMAYYGYFGQILQNGDMGLDKEMNECYRRLREDAWSNDNINHIIDIYEKQIFGSGAYIRDMERWPKGTYTNPDEGLDKFRHYVLARFKECDKYYGLK